ncbi:MAG: hypothetical protein KC442_18380 [Thermomicrobiales bacterium]|nr:hypothetical protein [Thermomicrobiales bacterium]
MDTLPRAATILVIEDDSATSNLLGPALEHAGYRVHVADRTPSAQTLTTLRPDLLVIDLTSGGAATNWQIVREVEDRTASPGLPIIVYGGDGAFVSAGDVRTHSRATAVLARPVRLEVLLPVLSHALDLRRDWRMDVHHLSDDPLPESAWGW